EVGMLVAGDAPHLKRLLSALGGGARGNAGVWFEILKRLTLAQQVMHDGANFDWFESLRLGQPFAWLCLRLSVGVEHRLAVGIELFFWHQMVPQPKEPRHFRGGAEIGRIA